MITLNRVKVGGEPISWDKETGILCLAGQELTADEWHELSRRVSSLVTGRVERRHKEAGAESLRISPFITANIMSINRHVQGMFKTPPFWLRPFYSAIITKEKLNDSY